MTRENPFRDDQNNRTINVKGHDVIYRGHTIVEKRDFGDGFRISAFMVKHGYVVTKDGCNVMPGACWFQTVSEAMRAIDDLIASETMPRLEPDREHPFWALNCLRRNAEERAPELALLLEELVSTLDRSKSSDATLAIIEKVEPLLDQIDWNCDMRTTVVPPNAAPFKSGPRTFGRFGGVASLGLV